MVHTGLVVLIDYRGSLIAYGALRLHWFTRPSWYSQGYLVHAGCMMLSISLVHSLCFGTFRFPGSLCVIGTLYINGSLLPSGTFRSCGSLSVIGTIEARGSLNLNGTLSEVGSLRDGGAFNGNGSLMPNGTFAQNGSLVGDDAFSAAGSL